jgi:hypothetical protein
MGHHHSDQDDVMIQHSSWHQLRSDVHLWNQGRDIEVMVIESIKNGGQLSPPKKLRVLGAVSRGEKILNMGVSPLPLSLSLSL